MKTRDGARLASYIARPVGHGTVRRRAAAHAVHAHPPPGGPLLGVARLHLRRAARARPRRLRRQGLRRLRHRRPRRLRRRRVGGAAARRERPRRHDRPLRRGTPRLVRRGERAAASRGDRAVGGDGRSVAHRAVRGHGVLADQRRVGVPHARAHAAEHQRSRHRRGAQAPAAQRSAAAARLRATCRSGIDGSRIPRSTRIGARTP